MIPSGSSLPIRIGAIDESFRLAQAQPVPSDPYKGDLLVLSTRPGLVARFIQTGPTTFERSQDLISYVPGEPTSMAFGRSGHMAPVGSTSIMRDGAFAMRLPTPWGATVPLAAALTTGCVPTPVGQN